MNVSKVLGCWVGAGGLLLAGLLVGGCETKPATAPFAELPGITTGPEGISTPAGPAGASPMAPQAGATGSQGMLPGATNTPIDIIEAGAALRITFSDLPILQQPFEDRVKQDGTITLMLNQTFKAAGKTRSELEKEIRDRYVPKYYLNMTVQVTIQEQTRFYFVGGEVKAPGRQVYLGPMTVLKAIQSCGDFTDFAKRTAVELTRPDGRKFEVDCKKARQDPSLDLDVYPGDKIYVPRKLW